jgi:ubiquinone/menaquinone biosynthesis C-methylase UbiE
MENREGSSPEPGPETRQDLSPEQQIAEVGRRDRGLESYTKWFDLRDRDLEGKRVLDLGAGQGQFAQDVENSGIKSEIISLDPVAEVDKEKQQGTNVQIDVRGRAQALPFRDASFDLILANNSLPFWSLGYPEQDKEKLDRLAEAYYNRDKELTAEETETFLSTMSGVISECARVLKPGGRAMFAPFDVFLYRAPLTKDFNEREIKRLYKELKDRLKSEKIKVRTKLTEALEIPPEKWRNPDNADERGEMGWQRLEITK